LDQMKGSEKKTRPPGAAFIRGNQKLQMFLKRGSPSGLSTKKRKFQKKRDANREFGGPCRKRSTKRGLQKRKISDESGESK